MTWHGMTTRLYDLSLGWPSHVWVNETGGTQLYVLVVDDDLKRQWT